MVADWHVSLSVPRSVLAQTVTAPAVFGNIGGGDEGGNGASGWLQTPVKGVLQRVELVIGWDCRRCLLVRWNSNQVTSQAICQNLPFVCWVAYCNAHMGGMGQDTMWVNIRLMSG